MPPKRVAIACKFCRSRKRKCDGKLPRCTSCQNNETECIYEDVTQPKIDPAKRLENIEALLKAHSDAIAELSRYLPPDASRSPWTREHPREHRRSQSYNHNPQSSTTPVNALSVESLIQDKSQPETTPKDNSTIPLFNIPFGHRATTSSLLVLPQVRTLVGEFPQDTFFRLEARRPSLNDISFDDLPLIHRASSHELLERFFALVYPYHPLFEREDFMAQYHIMLDRGLRRDEGSAVILVVLALGAIASEARPEGGKSEYEMPGFLYFNTACQLLVTSWTNSFGGNIVLTQGLVLCALYLLYLMRPLQAWRLIHMASTSIQQTLIGSQQLSETEQESIHRVCWSCFLIECDNLAEFDHPRSGIEPLVDQLPFPRRSPPDLDLQRYLANLSIRCLLNRIHHCLYFSTEIPTQSGLSPLTPRGNAAPSPPQPPNKSLSRICAELDLQLENWYGMLPEAIRPALDPGAPDGIHARLLQLRYWSAKQFIYRPYVVYAMSAPSDRALSEDVLDACHICVSACRAYIYTCADFLSTASPSAYTYMGAQCCLGSILILTLSANCPALQHLVSDIDVLQSLAIDSLESWSIPGSSLECGHEIGISIRTKQRLRG
ncbi:uncharacterized protein BDV17DRAFT_259428 [Aspergillus undulatus]|uniref:uncharacterized protein n=1 Tax=Aspergillus undulatus TaxID=1810928 RepID=UPI003CCC9DDE